MRIQTLTRWCLLGFVTAAQCAVAVALRFVPLSVARAGLEVCRPIALFLVRDSSDRIAKAIEATGRRAGGLSSCLARAVVGELLLDRWSPITVSIGVRRSGPGTLDAHAWVTRADRVVIGAPVDDYVPIVVWSHPADRTPA